MTNGNGNSNNMSSSNNNSGSNGHSMSNGHCNGQENGMRVTSSSGSNGSLMNGCSPGSLASNKVTSSMVNGHTSSSSPPASPACKVTLINSPASRSMGILKSALTSPYSITSHHLNSHHLNGSTNGANGSVIKFPPFFNRTNGEHSLLEHHFRSNVTSANSASSIGNSSTSSNGTHGSHVTSNGTSDNNGGDSHMACSPSPTPSPSPLHSRSPSPSHDGSSLVSSFYDRTVGAVVGSNHYNLLLAAATAAALHQKEVDDSKAEAAASLRALASHPVIKSELERIEWT